MRKCIVAAFTTHLLSCRFRNKRSGLLQGTPREVTVGR
jgi:hypothetical protein